MFVVAFQFTIYTPGPDVVQVCYTLIVYTFSIMKLWSGMLLTTIDDCM